MYVIYISIQLYNIFGLLVSKRLAQCLAAHDFSYAVKLNKRRCTTALNYIITYLNNYHKLL